MSTITRAFTTRRLKSSVDLRDNDSFPHRSNTTRAAMGSIRNKISAPVELIHTTNMLSYNAPDLFPKAPSSATSSKSDSDSDTAPTTASTTPPTSPDTPFPEKRSESPEPNHLSCYFSAPKHQSAAAAAATTTTSPASPDAPAIPQRAPSHTKKSYEGLVRHRSASRLSEQSTRSISTKSSFTFSRSSSSSTSTSTTSVSHTSASHMQKPSLSLPPPPPPPAAAAPPAFHSRDLHKKDYSESHPFGQELAQVSELAEEYGIKDKLSPMEQEEQDLLQQGLKKFSAGDYLSEIRSLTAMFFAEPARPMAAVWI